MGRAERARTWFAVFNAAVMKWIVYDINPASVAAMVKDGAVGTASVEEFVSKLRSCGALERIASIDHRTDGRATG